MNQHMPCLVAVVDCTHVGSATASVLQKVLTVNQHMPCLVAVVDCTHVGSATASILQKVLTVNQPCLVAVVTYLCRVSYSLHPSEGSHSESTHAMSCCCFDCTHVGSATAPFLQKVLTVNQHMPCLVAVVTVPMRVSYSLHPSEGSHSESTMSCCCC